MNQTKHQINNFQHLYFMISNMNTNYQNSWFKLLKVMLVVSCIFSSGVLLGQTDTIPPRFGPDNHYLDFISHTVIYPREAAIKGLQGRVDFILQIDSTGCFHSIDIIESPDKLLSEALIAAASKTNCNWIPASIDGKATLSSLKSSFSFHLR